MYLFMCVFIYLCYCLYISVGIEIEYLYNLLLITFRINFEFVTKAQ